ncbi:hypothetical protein BG005_006282 [Podila minutissima]|nr:hypothetical protein BG005_006282 [Podila minutissima]
MHPPDWEIPLKSTKLKALTISSIHQRGQTKLLYKNPSIKFLDWTHLGSDGNPVHFVNALSKLGHSVRELRLRNTQATGRLVALIISQFPSLEQLSVVFRPHPAKRLNIQEHALAKASSARYIRASIPTVKHLTISVYSMQAGMMDVLLEILTRCPGIMCIQVEVYTCMLESVHYYTEGIQSAILEWRHQYLKWKRLQAEEKEAGVEPDDKSQKLNTEQGLDDLIIKLYSDHDLLAISTVVGEQDTADIFKYMRSFKHTLRRVDLDFLDFDTYFSRLFREILTIFTGLESLRILTPKRFSRNVSASVFQRQKTPVKMACTTLKSLDICFYYGETVYRARKVLYTGDELWTWPAFTE